MVLGSRIWLIRRSDLSRVELCLGEIVIGMLVNFLITE